MTLRLILVRHARTRWNEEGRLQGRADAPLSKAGVGQSRELAHILRSRGTFAALHVSPQRRTVETARVLAAELVRAAGPKPELKLWPELAEMALADWEGCTFAEVAAADPVGYADFWDAPQRFAGAPGGGESFHALLERVRGYLWRIRDEEPPGDILVVTHSLTIKAIRLAISGGRLEEFWAESEFMSDHYCICEHDARGWSVGPVGKLGWNG